MDRIIEGDHKIIINMTLGEEIIGKHRTIEVRIIEVDIETITETCTKITTETIIEITIEMTTLTEIEEVGLEKDNAHITLGGITEVVVDQHQDQHSGLDQAHGLELIEIELGVISVENMTILQVNAQFCYR